MTRYRWVGARKAEGFPVRTACRVAKVASASFYEWCQRSSSPTEAEWAEAILVNRIVDIHTESDSTSGSPRVHAA